MTNKIALVVGVALLVPLFAFARHADVTDGNDTKGPLDIKRSELVQVSPAKWNVKTWVGWKAAEVWDRGFVVVYIDTFGSSRVDYYALVRSNGSKMVGALYRDRANKKDFKVRSVRAGHPQRRLVRVVVPLGQLRRRDSKVFRWYTLTMFSGERCKRFCFDRAPNEGAVIEPGPAPTETPTLPPPTPTVTP